MRIPVPKHSLLTLALVGAVLTGTLTVALAHPVAVADLRGQAASIIAPEKAVVQSAPSAVGAANTPPPAPSAPPTPTATAPSTPQPTTSPAPPPTPVANFTPEVQQSQPQAGAGEDESHEHEYDDDDEYDDE